MFCVYECGDFFSNKWYQSQVVEIVEKSAKMLGLKFDIEQFDIGMMNFNIWQSNVKDVLVQQELLKAL